MMHPNIPTATEIRRSALLRAQARRLQGRRGRIAVAVSIDGCAWARRRRRALLMMLALSALSWLLVILSVRVLLHLAG